MFSLAEFKKRLHSRIEDPKIRASRDLFSSKVIMELLLNRGPMSRDDLANTLINYGTKTGEAYSDWESCRNHVKEMVKRGKAEGTLFEDARGRILLTSPGSIVTMTNGSYFAVSSILLLLDYVTYFTEPLSIFALSLFGTAVLFSTAMYEFLRVLKFRGHNGSVRST